MVTTTPVTVAKKGFLVMKFTVFCRRSPAARWMPFEVNCIPYMKRANAPANSRQI
jgi:hypothetical protein